MEAIDNIARDRISNLEKKVEQHATDYWGPDMTNGKRSEVVDLVHRVDMVEGKIKHYEDTRESTCIGLAAFNEYLKSQEKGELEMKLENQKGKTLMGIQWIQLIGILAVALIAAVK